MPGPEMRDGGARRLLNSLIDSINTLVTAVNTLVTNSGNGDAVTEARLSAIRDSLSKPAQWNAMADGGALLTTVTAKILKPAAGAGLKNRIDFLQVSNSSAISGGTVEIMDGSTTVWKTYIGPNGSVGLPCSILGSANTAFNAKLSVALLGGILVNAQGSIL